MANDTCYRTYDSANDRRHEESEPSLGRMGSAQSEISDSELSAEDLEALSSGATFFETVGYNGTGGAAEVYRLLGQVVRKIESLGDAFIYFLRCLVVAGSLWYGFYIIPRLSFYSRRSSDLDELLVILFLPVVMACLIFVFQPKTSSERTKIIQRYNYYRTSENINDGVISNRSSVEVKYQNINKVIIDVIAYSFVVIAIGAALVSIIYAITFSLVGSGYALELLQDILRFGSIPLILLLVTVIAVRMQDTIGYDLTFDREGISGKYLYLGHKTASFVAVYENFVYSSNKEHIGCSSECVRWINFMCFSYHENCLLLWREPQPNCNFWIRLFIKFGWYIDLYGNYGNRPLRIVGTEDEIRELKDFLSSFMPCLPAFGQDCRAIV